jgi:adenylosuccinate lyase
LAELVDKLVVYPERMRRNLDLLGGLVHSQSVLLELTQAGVGREHAYALVQRNAMPVWQNIQAGRPGRSFLDNLKADAEVVKSVPANKLEALFDLAHHFKHVDTIFRRVFGSP